ncbi:MAG TPA: patatin-like phospholipase family protein [Halomicronema sp.]
MVSKTFKKRILSIDGGGIRGMIPAILLNYIEKKTKKQIHTMFDMIAGTSTGGILALGLTKRNSDSESNYEAEYTAAELINFYRKYGNKIFSEYIPTPIDDLMQPKFNPVNKHEVLTSLLGEARIENALKEVFITSYDIELRTPIFFTSNYKAEETECLESRKICRGFTMVNAAMATSAAPTFFPPYKLKTVHRTSEDYYALVDGGIFANNPTALALMETMISYQRKTGHELHRDDILVVSLGTGSLTRKYKYQDAKNWGQLKWALPLLNIVFDGQSESVAYQLNQLMMTKGDDRNYYRFQVPLSADNGHDQMDNASSSNIEYLEKLSEILIEQRRESLDQLCEVLCQPCEHSTGNQ